MVLPDEIGDAAQDADEDDGARVLAWLDSGGDINDGDKDGFTLIHCCAIGIREGAVITDGNVSRGLAQRGNLAVQDWHSDTFRETWALEFLARLGDNGVVWHVLTYWRPTE